VTPVGENWTSTLTYKGREEDRETGLVSMRHRYYSPRLERFVNEDPIGIGGGLNLFLFGGTDPVNRSDPYGLYPWFPPHQCELNHWDIWGDRQGKPYLKRAHYCSEMGGAGPVSVGDQFEGWTDRGHLSGPFAMQASARRNGRSLPRAGGVNKVTPAAPPPCGVAVASAGFAVASDFLALTGIGMLASRSPRLVGNWVTGHWTWFAPRQAMRAYTNFFGEMAGATILDQVSGAWGVEPLADGGFLGALETIGGFIPGANATLAILRAVQTC
jgi:RHS repeat-associated protein